MRWLGWLPVRHDLSRSDVSGKERLAYFQARTPLTLRSIHNLHKVYGELTELECVQVRLGHVNMQEHPLLLLPQMNWY